MPRANVADAIDMYLLDGDRYLIYRSPQKYWYLHYAAYMAAETIAGECRMAIRGLIYSTQLLQGRSLSCSAPYFNSPCFANEYCHICIWAYMKIAP